MTPEAALDPAWTQGLSWPLARLGEALERLGRACGLTSAGSAPPSPPSDLHQQGRDAVDRWIEAAALALGFDAEPLDLGYLDMERLLVRSAPLLVRLPGTDPPRFVALLRARRRSVTVLRPDLVRVGVRLSELRSALVGGIEVPHAGAVESLLDAAGLDGRRRAGARGELLRRLVGNVKGGTGWVLRLQPGAPFRSSITQAGVPGHLLAFFATQLVHYVLFLASWWLMGRAVLEGRFDRGWLLAWGLVLLTLVPLQMLATWLQGYIAIAGGGVLKQRLLHGALRLEPEDVRTDGVGHLLARVLESDVLETLALSGGFQALVALMELTFAGFVLWAGAGGLPHALLLLGWTLVVLLGSWRYFHLRRGWTKARLDMTHDLVERMVGHRTRLAQEPPGRWHSDEDRLLESYLDASRRMDRLGAILMGSGHRGWLMIGVLGLAPTFVSGGASQPFVAVALGGVLLASGAFMKLVAGVQNLSGALIAWDEVASLSRAAGRKEEVGAQAFLAALPADGGYPILRGEDLVFRYAGRPEPVLRHCKLEIGRGERLLLEGPSGCGKSTLASIITGLRRPQSGLLLLHGLDRHTLGSLGWRRHVVSAPQFHENHVLAESLAFNLLLGRRWPPSDHDLEEAQQICEELGLGPLLERMPGGMLQMVGESGWQLSHGERSRLFIARALLQGADLFLFDENFAALDPQTLEQCLTSVLKRAPTVLVIAHP